MRLIWWTPKRRTPPPGYLVNFRFGRRGQTLQEGTKTPAPVSREAADKIFDSVVVSKLNDGYRRMDGGDSRPRHRSTAAPTQEGRERELTAAPGGLPAPAMAASRNATGCSGALGETRFAAAGPLLIAIAESLGTCGLQL